MSNTWAPWTYHGLPHRPPRAWLWWASRAGGRRSIYRGWGDRGSCPGLRTPLLNGGGPGVSLPGGVTGVGPLWWGAPPGRGEGTSPLAPHVGGTGPSLCSFSVAPGCVVRRVPVLRNRFYYFTPPPLAAVSRFLHWWLPLPPPAVIEYSLAFRSLAGMRVRRRNQRSQFVVRQYEREEGFEACAQLWVPPQAVGVLVHVR